MTDSILWINKTPKELRAEIEQQAQTIAELRKALEKIVDLERVSMDEMSSQEYHAKWGEQMRWGNEIAEQALAAIAATEGDK